MERKFVSRLFINQAKESGKTYLKGNITIKQADIKGFINSDGDLVVPVFGHTFIGKNKQNEEYKAFNLEIVNEENNQKNSKRVQEISESSKKTKSNIDLPF
jgi:hypothetical protein